MFVWCGKFYLEILGGGLMRLVEPIGRGKLLAVLEMWSLYGLTNSNMGGD
jgi:hypothetical protein